MKKGLFYHCIALSLIFHLAVVLLIALEKPPERKRREPIAVDLLEPPRLGPKTVLPPNPKKESALPARMPTRMAMAVPRTAVRKAIPYHPFLPSFPVPREAKPAPAQARVSPGSLKVPGKPAVPPAPPAPSPGQKGGGAPSAARTPSLASAGRVGEGSVRQAPPRFKLPTPEEAAAAEYTKAEVKRTRDPNAITLDTRDLQYMSYLHSLRNAIEHIWEYPETARREGIQGELLMKFTILKSGKVTDVEVLQSSGYPMLDEAAKKALFDASPFNPLPDNWKKDSFTITGNFVYMLYGKPLNLY